jgi:hypothetical protein
MRFLIVGVNPQHFLNILPVFLLQVQFETHNGLVQQEEYFRL